ncbi:MAG: hypothetical protein V2B19_31445 [Pseudomonadota bacterium]
MPVLNVEKIIFFWIRPLNAAAAWTEEAALNEDAEKTVVKRTIDPG